MLMVLAKRRTHPKVPDPAAKTTPQQGLGGQQGQPQTDPHGFTLGWHGTVPGGDVEADDSCREKKKMKTKLRDGETGNYNVATVAGDEGGIRLGR